MTQNSIKSFEGGPIDNTVLVNYESHIAMHIWETKKVSIIFITLFVFIRSN